MAFDYTGARSRASALLDKAGQTVTWTRLVAGSEDIDAGTVTQGTPLTYSITAVVTGFKERDIDGTLVQRGDKMLLLAAADFSDAGVTPVDSDRVTISSEVHEVVNLEAVNPGGTAVLWKAQVRAAG